MSTYGSGTYGSGTYGDALALVRDADLSRDRLRELAEQLSNDSVSPEDFAAANPDVAPIVRMVDPATLLAVLGILIALYFGNKQVELAERQVELGRAQVEIGKRQVDLARQDGARETTTGALTDRDIERILQALEQQRIAAEAAPKR